MSSGNGLSERQLQTLWHALGMTTENYRRTLAWWHDNDNHRNDYACEASGRQAREVGIDVLLARGFMAESHMRDRHLHYYYVTAHGITVARDAFTAKQRAERGKAPADEPLSVHQKIMRAAKRKQGLRLSADEVFDLAADGAVARAAWNQDNPESVLESR